LVTDVAFLLSNHFFIAAKACDPIGRYLCFLPLPITDRVPSFMLNDVTFNDVISLNLNPELYINSIIALSLIEAKLVSGMSHSLSIWLIDSTSGNFCSRLGTIIFFEGFSEINFFLYKKEKNDLIEDAFLEMLVARNPDLLRELIYF
jgi:uncharacterized protein YciU (UPF0263 family)